MQTRDGRLSAFLKSYLAGSLYLWNGQAVIGDSAASDANGKRASLLDPLTLQPLVKDGVPVVVPLREIHEVDLPRSTQIGQRCHAALALWSSDFGKRIAAIQRAGERQQVESLPALAEIAKADPSGRIRHTAQESIDLIQLTGTFPDGISVDRLQAARDLGSL